jgi:hypothetical protein
VFIHEDNIEHIYEGLRKTTYYTRYKQTEAEVKIHPFKYKPDDRRPERERLFKESILNGMTVTEIKAVMMKTRLCTPYDFSSKMSYYEEKYGRAVRGFRDKKNRINQKEVEYGKA